MSTDLQTGQDTSPSIQPAFKATLAESTQASMVYSYVLERKNCSAGPNQRRQARQQTIQVVLPKSAKSQGHGKAETQMPWP